MALDKASRVGAEVAEFGHLDPCLETEDALDVRHREAVTLQKPEAEELVIQSAWTSVSPDDS